MRLKIFFYLCMVGDFETLFAFKLFTHFFFVFILIIILNKLKKKKTQLNMGM